MKSLRDYSVNITEDEYHAHPAWNHSKIVRYAREGFACLSTLHERTVPTPSMEFGSLFDSMITKGKKTKDEYAVCSVSVPEAERKALDYISTMTVKNFDELDPGWIYDRTQECGYQPKWKMDTKYEKLKAYREYFDLRKSGKKLVSQQDWNEALEMYCAFRQNDYLKTIFGTKNTEDVEYLYQLKFVADMTLDSGKTVQCRIMPDLLVVNHKDKTIQPVDLKTSADPAFSFEESFLRFRYDIQAQLYSDVLKEVISKTSEYQDYTIKDYLFTDISRSDKIPVTWWYPQDDPSQVHGLVFSSRDKEYSYRGWKILLDEIVHYEETQAKVPDYIDLNGPNSLLEILSKK